MLYRLVRIGEKRNKSIGSGECSSLEKLCTCIGTGMCKGVTFRRSAGADFGLYLLFSCSSALRRLPSSSAGFLAPTFDSPGGASV